MPDPVEGGGAYVAVAYIVFVTLILVYLVILGAKFARIERELETLERQPDEQESP